MYYVYIIYSKAIDRYYIGHTQDIEGRLYHHRNSGSKATKKAKDWELVYTESWATRSEACVRELKIKSMKSRVYIQQLIDQQG